MTRKPRPNVRYFAVVIASMAVLGISFETYNFSEMSHMPGTRLQPRSAAFPAKCCLILLDVL